MDKNEFKKLLFDVACSTMACDGHIHEREVRELKYIEKSTTYFQGIDLSRRLDRFVENFKENPKETFESVFGKLKESFLNPVDEMLVLEIVLRMIYSDTKIDPKEIDFLQSIRAYLSIDDEEMTLRFGIIDFLINEKEDVTKTKKEKTENIDMTNLENIYFGLGSKKEKD